MSLINTGHNIHLYTSALSLYIESAAALQHTAVQILLNSN